MAITASPASPGDVRLMWFANGQRRTYASKTPRSIRCAMSRTTVAKFFRRLPFMQAAYQAKRRGRLSLQVNDLSIYRQSRRSLRMDVARAERSQCLALYFRFAVTDANASRRRQASEKNEPNADSPRLLVLQKRGARCGRPCCCCYSTPGLWNFEVSNSAPVP